MTRVIGKFIKQDDIEHQSLNGAGYYDHAAIDAFINGGTAAEEVFDNTLDGVYVLVMGSPYNTYQKVVI